MLGREDCQVANSRSTARSSITPTTTTVQLLMLNNQLLLTGNGMQQFALKDANLTLLIVF